MALFGTPPAVHAQLARPEHFSAAFAFINEVGRAGSEAHRQLFAQNAGETGRVELPGGAFALPQSYLTKTRSEGRWETHRAFIDIQAVFAGEEFMEVAARDKLTLREDLTPSRDVIFYEAFNRGSALRL